MKRLRTKRINENQNVISVIRDFVTDLVKQNGELTLKIGTPLAETETFFDSRYGLDMSFDEVRGVSISDGVNTSVFYLSNDPIIEIDNGALYIGGGRAKISVSIK